ITTQPSTFPTRLSSDLQIASRNVQWNIRTVNNAAQHRQKFGHNSFYIIGYENLVLIELDFIFLNAHIVRHLWEIKDSRKIERIINIQMNVKKGLLKLHWVQFPVKRIVIFVFQLRGLLCPRWIWIIDYIVNFLRWRLVFFFCMFGFWKCFRPHSKFNWNWHKLVVLHQKFANTAFFQKLCGIFSNVK